MYKLLYPFFFNYWLKFLQLAFLVHFPCHAGQHEIPILLSRKREVASVNLSLYLRDISVLNLEVTSEE